MIRIAKEIDFKRIEELKRKIDDQQYLESAIQVIAQDLTDSIFEEEA